MSEHPQIDVQIRGDNDRFWLKIVIDGYEVSGSPIRVNDYAEGDKLAERVQDQVRRVYQSAYYTGRRDAQKQIREAMGVME